MEFSKIDFKFIRHRRMAAPGLPNLSNTRYFSSILTNFNWRNRHFVVEINFFNYISMVGNKIHLARHFTGF